MATLSWINIAQRLQSIAQTGLTYAQDPYDRERYEEIAGIAMSMFAGGQPEHIQLAAKLFADETGYATPKVDVRAAIFRDGKILLVREREDGCWTLPGGWADVGISPAESVEKEVREEAGLAVKARKLLAAWDRNKHPHPPHAFHIYKLVFDCEIISGAPAAGSETSEAAFFGENEIPPLSLTRILPEQIARIFEHLRHPDWPTEFD
ncbi:MAG TPA: NUDIX hydrolase [Bryobacteraceae bacterium]|jgi:ADP-ribose pyrophosphatase YjhB (NUDIX family)